MGSNKNVSLHQDKMDSFTILFPVGRFLYNYECTLMKIVDIRKYLKKKKVCLNMKSMSHFCI